MKEKVNERKGWGEKYIGGLMGGVEKKVEEGGVEFEMKGGRKWMEWM